MSSELISKLPNDVNVRFLSENLRYLMKAKGLDTPDLYKITGIAATTINSLKKGVGNPTLSTLQILADFFGVSVGQLTEGEINSNSRGFSSAHEIPLIELGNIIDFLNNCYKPNNAILVELDKQNSSHYFAITLPNNSLAPIFDKGTIFIICKELPVRDGDIVLVQFSQQFPCFRKVFIEDETFFFSPLSEVIGKDVVRSKSFVIHGVVVKAIQNFQE